jgi:quercetin dioxygenase-like cupin family protein
MSMNRTASIFLLLAAAGPVPPSAPQVSSIIQTGTTMDGQPLVLPPGPAQVAATRIVVPAGAGVGTHMHFWGRYVYVESGQVEVTLADSGATRRFAAGEMIVEPIGKWHSVKAIADSVLIAVEQVPAGRCNTVKPPAQAQPNDC